PTGSYFAEYAWSCPILPCGTITLPPASTICPNRTCTGGGVSTIKPVPPYQTAIIPNYVTTPGRMVPDVGADANPTTGIVVYQNGSPSNAFGTSASAPIWAGFLALAAPPNTTSQQVLTALYSLALTPTAYQANFHDIQFGINGSCGPQCQANPGYDLLTGLGSPQGNALVPTLGALLGATPFPTATGTATSTRTPSPVPAQCSPRPVVGGTV